MVFNPNRVGDSVSIKEASTCEENCSDLLTYLPLATFCEYPSLGCLYQKSLRISAHVEAP